jgi:predicted RNA-binding Zn-ribbon protein involved in translation (DUF1610 family)
MGMTYFRCPKCQRQIAAVSGIRSRMMDIGPPVIPCSYCQAPVATGAQEWVDLPDSRKRAIRAETYLYGGLVLAPLLAVVAFFVLLEGFKAPRSIAFIVAIATWGAVLYRSHKAHLGRVSASLRRKPSGDGALKDNDSKLSHTPCRVKNEIQLTEHPSSDLRPSRVERECPECAELILAKASVCKHCHSKLQPVAG